MRRRPDDGHALLVVGVRCGGRVKKKRKFGVIGMLLANHPLEGVPVADLELGHLVDRRGHIRRQLRGGHPCGGASVKWDVWCVQIDECVRRATRESLCAALSSHHSALRVPTTTRSESKRQDRLPLDTHFEPQY